MKNVEEMAQQASQVGLTSNRFTQLTLATLQNKFSKFKGDVEALKRKANEAKQQQMQQMRSASLGMPNASLGMPNASLGMPNASLGMPNGSFLLCEYTLSMLSNSF